MSTVSARKTTSEVVSVVILLGFARPSSIPAGSHCFRLTNTGHREWLPNPRLFPTHGGFRKSDLRCSTLSGRSERASNLPLCLHQNPCPGLLPVRLYRK